MGEEFVLLSRSSTFGLPSSPIEAGPVGLPHFQAVSYTDRVAPGFAEVCPAISTVMLGKGR